MEKTNIKFHDNYTVTFQHKKILQFVPELSVDKNQRIVTPNIPLLTLSTQSNSLGYFLAKTISLMLTAAKYKPFIELTVDELVFGYDDTLRNGTLPEIQTIYTGHTGMDKFGYLNRINGLDHLPFWKDPPCRNITASEGSLFPPREITGSDID
uniref:Uncharacterized protein n=1 Tax=Phlebotomus papatasi TaxID=29031 RepID=A0A1B0GM02_PHLPP